MHCLLKLAALALTALPLASALSGQGVAPKCNITQSVLANEVPTNQSAVIPPSNVTLVQVTIGFGTQNYTCTSGKFVNVGALAQVFDISCIENLPVISNALSAAINELQHVDGQGLINFAAMIAKMSGFKLADHYFDTSSGPLSPVFNFAASGGGFVIGKKLVDIPAPVDPTVNVDWLQLTAAAGDAAKFVVREETAGGQPPSSCTAENENLQVPYAAKYWFFA